MDNNKVLTLGDINRLKRRWNYLRDETTSMTSDGIRSLTDEVIDTFPTLLNMAATSTATIQQLTNERNAFFEMCTHYEQHIFELQQEHTVHSTQLTHNQTEAIHKAQDIIIQNHNWEYRELSDTFPEVFDKEVLK